jgi:hypothetical protein
MTHSNFQLLRVREPTLRMKAKADSRSRGQKVFICREEKKKVTWGMQGDLETGGPVVQVGNWVLIALFYIARRQRCLSGLMGRRSVSLANYHLLGPPAVPPYILPSQ